MARRKKMEFQDEPEKSEVVISETQQDEPEQPIDEEVNPEPPIEPEPEISEPEVQTVEIVYLGTSEKATVRGSVTGQKYEFYRDEYNMPKATTIDERDSSGILALQGKACCGKDPLQLFMRKVDWDLEVESAKVANR